MANTLREILYSAILWGSLITWGLWRLRRAVHGDWGRIAVWSALFWFGWQTAVAWLDFVLPPSVRLIEADTGKPIANRRAVLTWHSYPIPLIWLNFCTGRQAHLSDADGHVAFRFTPYPALLSGTLSRDLDTIVPGRFRRSIETDLLAPIRGDLPMERLGIGGGHTSNFGYSSCDFNYRPQYYYDASGHPWASRVGLLPGEESAFDTTYREACVEQQPGTLHWAYMEEIVLSARPFAWKGQRDRPRVALPAELEQGLASFLDDRCDSHYRDCTRPVTPQVRAQFCSYVKEVRVANELP